MRSRWRVLVGKVAALSAAEWRALLEAQLALLWAQCLVATRPVGRLLSSAEPGPAVPDADRTAPLPLDERAAQLALAVSRAGDFGLFRPLCLVRAVALSRLLDAHAIPGSRIRIGVRRQGNRFAAHAWVEYQGRVLGDAQEHVATFAELADMRLLPRA